MLGYGPTCGCRVRPLTPLGYRRPSVPPWPACASVSGRWVRASAPSPCRCTTTWSAAGCMGCSHPLRPRRHPGVEPPRRRGPAIDVTPDVDLFKMALGHWTIDFLVCDEAEFLRRAPVRPTGAGRSTSSGWSVALGSSPTSAAGCSTAPAGCSSSPTNTCRCRSRRGAGAAPGHPQRPGRQR